mmetsp:Transcript_10876/g.23018  ORF Transcript_10876/g.23018 Transcript_10876/m.23018 type:complete len:232 (+) Transcript_10876:49-744(+)
MKVIIYATLANAAFAFAPVPGSVPSTTAPLRMSLIDDLAKPWKDFFSPEEARHRQEQHDAEVKKMMQDQKEILERRRDPKKMAAYHQQEEKRHELFDHQHDVDIDNELAKEWTPSDHPLVKDTYEKKSHNALDDFISFFSKEAKEERKVQHHIEMLEIEDAEKQILGRRRNPDQMKQYKAKEDARHQMLDKRHEVEVGLEFAEEDVLEEGQDFVSGLLDNVFGGRKTKQKN